MIVIASIFILKNAFKFKKLAYLEMICSCIHGVRMIIDTILSILALIMKISIKAEID